MPELPEVETIVRDLRPRITGKLITGLLLRAKALVSLLQCDPDTFYQGVMNQTIVTVLRKGKYIIVPLSNNNVIVFHLGMTGRLLLGELSDVDFEEQLSSDDYIDKHTHVVMEITDPSEEEEDFELHFNDVRLFGKMWLVEDAQSIDHLDVPGLKGLGPDALGISLKDFELVSATTRAIKSVLLDQTRVAGIGNIYADEACFAAGVHPAIRASSLTNDQRVRLWFSIKSVLKEGIKHKGSSTSDYTTVDGSKGTFQTQHRVYGKTGQKCIECGSTIERIKVAGRSTHFCPTCQPER